MKIIFIGTGSGKTSLKRNHSSIALIKAGGVHLIDCGDGVSRALLSAKISPLDIDSILISHFHADHAAGLPSLVTQMKLQHRTKKLKIFTYKHHVEFVALMLECALLFQSNLGFDLEIVPFENNCAISLGNGMSVLPRKNSHISEKYGETKFSNNQFYSASFLIQIENSNLYYSADIGNVEDLKIFCAFSCDTAILETTHVNTDDLNKFIESGKFKRVFLTHIGDETEIELQKWIAKIRAEYSASIQLAYDGFEIEII
ncbi:MAG: MBL fold metallo-hydrolase [Bacteroidota bacterium]